MAHATLRVELNVDGKRQAILVGTQRAQIVRQALGQHGQHAIGKIHRRRAMAGFQIDMSVPGNIVRNVGNMDTQLVATLERALQRDGVVKVARVDRINRNDKAIAQVSAERVLERRGHVKRKRLGLGKCGLGIAVGIAIARHHILNAQIGRIIAANTALDRHGARFQTRRICQNARDDRIARMNAQALRRGVLRQNKEIGLKARIKRLDHPERAGGLVRAHHTNGCTLDDALDYGASLAMRAVLNAYGNGIAVHNLALAAAHDLVVAVFGYNVGTMLMELHASGQTRAALAAHRPALIASSTLMLVIAPHGASLLSMAAYTPRVYPNDP